MSQASLVVPCYNEQKRLSLAGWQKLSRETGTKLVFVDDGSSDGTGEMLQRLVRSLPRDSGYYVRLEKNLGKAEAVRRGLLRAMDQGLPWVGFADADGATPVAELSRLMEKVLPTAPSVVLGSRVRLLGRHVVRRPVRHAFGRVFATLASLALRLPVYDTQCGAKFFRVTPALRAALQTPFSSRWIFDVELLGRLLYAEDPALSLSIRDFLEAPLHNWRDVAGSRLKPADLVVALRDLARIAIDVRQRRTFAAESSEAQAGRGVTAEVSTSAVAPVPMKRAIKRRKVVI